MNVITKQRSQNSEEVGKLLLILTNKKDKLAGNSISEKIICEKVKHLHQYLLNHLGSKNKLIHSTSIPFGKIVSVFELFGFGFGSQALNFDPYFNQYKLFFVFLLMVLLI